MFFAMVSVLKRGVGCMYCRDINETLGLIGDLTAEPDPASMERLRTRLLRSNFKDMRRHIRMLDGETIIFFLYHT